MTNKQLISQLEQEACRWQLPEQTVKLLHAAEARIKELEAKLKEYEAYNPWPDDEQYHAKRCRGYKDKS